jgi:membrane protein CcdC involved in cytochrome C biogenesis
MLVGALLVVYPYFVPSVALMAAIAVGLVVVLWGVVRMGI